MSAPDPQEIARELQALGAADASLAQPAGADVAVEPAPAPPQGYWYESRGPLASLLLVLPLLAFYEVGVLLLGPGALRNGADAWLRQFLELIGFGQYFLLPALTCVILLAWQHTSHQSWRISPRLLPAMAVECVLLALALRGLGWLQHRLLAELAAGQPWAKGEPLAPVWAAAGLAERGVFARMVGFVGAGVYEELLFRLMLLPATVAALRACGAPSASARWGAVFLTSLVFSAAHYVGPLGDAWSFYSFSFRLLAGIFFAALFLQRGFGIAAGTHAGYDLLVGL